MKRIARLLYVVITIFGLVSCGIISSKTSSGETSLDQSKFKQDFSIGPIIEAHQELLMDGPRALSGMEAGPREPFIQSQEYMIVQVNQENAVTLMELIQSEIQEAIINSGAKILGGGGDFQPDSIAYFSHSYVDGSIYGAINVWGIRGEDFQLILISQITESSSPNK